MRSNDIVVGRRERDRLTVEFSELSVTGWAAHVGSCPESDVAGVFDDQRKLVTSDERPLVESGPLGAVALVIDNEAMAHTFT